MRFFRWVYLVVCCGALGASDQAGSRYVVSTIAGGNYFGDNGPALAAIFDQPEGLATDSAGNIYISDSLAHRVRRVAANGMVQTVAGTGAAGFTGDNGPAVSARLNAPYGIAVDRFDSLYIADLANARVRKAGPDGRIYTFAGGGTRVPGDAERIPATEVRLVSPRNVAIDANGGVFISDFGAHRVYRVGPDGLLGVAAGNGNAGFSGDGAMAVQARLNFPCGLAVDRQGVLYIADSGNRRVRRVYQNFISTVAELGTTGANALGLATPTGLAIDKADNLYIADGRATLVRIDARGLVGAVAAGGSEVAADGAGNLYLTRQGSRSVSKYSGGTLLNFAGVATVPDVWGDGSPAGTAQLRTPSFLARDAAGNLAFSDVFSRRVRLIDGNGVIKSVVGASADPPSPEPAIAQANAVSLARPGGVAWDTRGNLYVADFGGNRIRVVSASGEARVIAGKPDAGFSGDGGLAVDAQLSAPAGLAWTPDGSLYFADSGNQRIRRITASGLIFTVAGGGLGKPGEEGSSVGIALEEPCGIAIGAEGTIYFTETAGNRIRMVNSSGQMVTLADAKTAGLQYPRGLSSDKDGTLWIADSGNHRIVTLTAQGVLATVAGTGIQGFSGDGGDPAAAEFDTPIAVLAVADGSVFISDSGNNRIRKLSVGSPALITPPAPITAAPPPVTGNAQAALLHSATWKESAVAPGQLATLSGQGLGPAGAVAGRVMNGRLETTAGGTEVRFDGVPAPLLYVQERQINLQVPHSVVGRERTEVTITRNGALAARFTVAVQNVAPGILTTANGAGQAVAARDDGKLNSTDFPISPGGIFVFYITGDGQSGSNGIDGLAAAAADPTKSSVTVEVGGYAAEVQYAGKAPGLLGVMQVNARLNPGTRLSGALSLTARIDGVPTQPGVILQVR